MTKRPVMLMILDGFGINEKTEGNAVKLANKPNIDRLMKIYPTTRIKASGEAVGLPEGQMGNSEVGHTNIGAGRIVYQDLTRITNAIENGDFFTNKVLTNAIENCKKNNTNLHIMGLVSDGGVHSHNRHLYALLELCKRKDFENVFIHCFLDGRDTPPISADSYIADLEEKIKEKEVGKIATISGRFYAMDRDKRWDRIQKAYNAMVYGQGETATSAEQAIENSYQKEVFDEFVEPTVIKNVNGPVATINNNDSVIFFNFRPDRAREITRALVDTKFNEFEVEKLNLHYVCFTEYDETMPKVQVAFAPERLTNTLGEILSKNNMTQLRIAETEKYAHVTFFFNGGEEKVYRDEDRILVDSPKVRTYDQKPEMSAYEVTEKLIQAIDKDIYDCIILNFANPDMVGHTGDLDATIKAIEAIDECVGKIEKEFVQNKGGIILLTADHGNAEVMIDYKTGEPNTAHTTNLVPLVLIGETDYKLRAGRLCDLAPTILALFDMKKPKEMKGESLLLTQVN